MHRSSNLVQRPSYRSWL